MTTMDGEKPKRKYKRTESWGATRKLPSGRYQASYVNNGKRYTKGQTFDTLQDARAWLASVRTDIQRGKWRDPETIHAETFGPYADKWLKERESSKGLRERTLAEYRRQLDDGLAEFKTLRLEQITSGRVRTWHAARAKKVLIPGPEPTEGSKQKYPNRVNRGRMKGGETIAAREAALLRAILATATFDEVIERNPVDPKLIRAKANMKKHRPPTLDELSVIVEEFEASAPRLKLAVLLAAFGGLRLSEWRALRVVDLTIDGDRVTVSVKRQALRIPGKKEWAVGPPKSAEGVRVVPLPTSIADDVRKHIENFTNRFGESLLFESSWRSDSSGEPFLHDAEFNRPWNRARKAASVRPDKDGLIVREHDLRHFHMSYFAQSGATLAELKARAGHSTTQAAMVYQHAVTDRGAELADAMPTLPARAQVTRIG